MTEGKGPGSPIPLNRFPLEPADTVAASAKGIFAVSPPGTGMCERAGSTEVKDTEIAVCIFCSAGCFPPEGRWDHSCVCLLEAHVLQCVNRLTKTNTSVKSQLDAITDGFIYRSLPSMVSRRRDWIEGSHTYHPIFFLEFVCTRVHSSCPLTADTLH